MLKGYKTIIFNVIMTLIMLANATGIVAIPGDIDVAGGIDDVEAALVVLWGIGNFILRVVTDTPVFEGDQNEK